MAKKVMTKSAFDYIAHIQKEDGTIVEIEGRKDFATHNDVFSWLQKRCSLLGGWLVSQHISLADKDSVIDVVPWANDKKDEATLDERLAHAGKAARTEKRGPSKFEDESIFGRFKRTYTGALPITFKERSASS